MNLKTKLALIMILLLNVSLFAQSSYPLSGTVSDGNDGSPIIGANVLVDNTTTGTTTDAEGRYTLNVKSGDVLKFSYIGYTTQSITITDQTTLDVKLVEGESVSEIIVVGYGTRKVSHNTGAISQVGGKDIAAIQSNRVDEALGGKLAGVLIQNQDGEPGADMKIQIRAASSISGDSDPLIVVDGFPISGNLSTVNPNDIESMEILKDAASAAIYGSRGANGVILVTTKKGKSGKPTISYSTYVSNSSRYSRDNINQTASEWATTLEQGVANGTYDISLLNEDVYNYKLNAYKNAPDVVAVEDWLFQNGNSMNHDLNISGGTDDIRYFASVGYLNTEGIAITQGFERYNARLNLDANLSPKLKAGLSINGFMGNRDMLGHDIREPFKSL